MSCLFEHNWGWPRKRAGKDIQVCLSCGAERESRIAFDGPRYHKTQDGIPNFSPASARSLRSARLISAVDYSSAA
jgi:hypothetical protein